MSVYRLWAGSMPTTQTFSNLIPFPYRRFTLMGRFPSMNSQKNGSKPTRTLCVQYKNTTSPSNPLKIRFQAGGQRDGLALCRRHETEHLNGREHELKSRNDTIQFRACHSRRPRRPCGKSRVGDTEGRQQQPPALGEGRAETSTTSTSECPHCLDAAFSALTKGHPIPNKSLDI